MKFSKGVKAISVFQLLMMAVLFALVMSPAHASELVANGVEQSVALFDVLAVFVGDESAAKWLAILGMIGYLFTHLRAWLPASWLAKLPQSLTVLMEVLSGNYRSTSNTLKSIDTKEAALQAETSYIVAKTRSIEIDNDHKAEGI